MGGLGGCPFAPGASGNVITEDLVFMFESMGVPTGISLESCSRRGNPRQGIPKNRLRPYAARGTAEGIPGRRVSEAAVQTATAGGVCTITLNRPAA